MKQTQGTKDAGGTPKRTVAHLNVPLTDTAVCQLLCHVCLVATCCLEVVCSKAPHELLALDNQDTQMSNVGPRSECVCMCGVVMGVLGEK